ncbi:hypothetical protein ACJX0J_040131, partial [Zea mays]
MSKENKATSHTPLIDHHYKTYHHRQTGRKSKVLGIDQSITHRASHHLAFCCPIGRQEATEGEKKGGTKGKIVMKIMLNIVLVGVTLDNCELVSYPSSISIGNEEGRSDELNLPTQQVRENTHTFLTEYKTALYM